MAAQQADVNAWFAANPNATAQQVYDAAQQYGVSGNMIDTALGRAAGISDSYVTSQGWGALPGTNNAPGGGGGGMLSNPQVSTVAGTGTNQYTMDSAYRKMYQDQVGKSGSGETYDFWRARPIGKEYQPTVAKMDSLGESYYGGQYKTKASEQAAWDNLISQSGLGADEFNNLYGKYMDRIPVEELKQLAPGGGPAYPANFNSQVDAGTETIEGRIQNLLNANNPVIRQAGERAMGQFAQRGLLNSSMAIEAANEAMISKAIEIAGPDAQRYFQNRRENVDWQNKFSQNEQLHGYDLEKIDAQARASENLASSNHARTLQTNYLQSIQSAESQMQRFIQSIQASDIPPEAKTAQIQQMQLSFNNTISMMKAAYKNMPQWVDEWSLFPASLEG